MENPGSQKFVVEDLTIILFEYDGHRFLMKTMEYVPEPARHVKNYEPDFQLY
jgi:hypothetical protein